ncbi:MAG: hypothetical protein ACRDG3_09400, partial [Tepidiformaceae bacterium]
WEDVHVGELAVVIDSIVADGVTIGAGARMTGAVVWSGCVIGAGAVVSPGAALQPGTRYDESDER